MTTVTLGWDTADNITGSIHDLLKQYPNNKPLKALYEALASGSDEPIVINFDDERTDND